MRSKDLLVRMRKIGLLALCLSTFVFLSCGGNIEVKAVDVGVDTVAAQNPILKVYFDNTGSMNGYVCDGSKLKDAVYYYISILNDCAESTEYYYINNSNITQYQDALREYINSLSPGAFRQMAGNRDNTNIGDMLEEILEEVDDSSVSIFVSDCILDLPQKNSLKYLTDCQITIMNAVNAARGRIPDLGVEILRMTSDFTGKYYYYGNTYDTLNDAMRPYYIWILGNRKSLAKLNAEAPITKLNGYGLYDYMVFTAETSVPFEITNRGLIGGVIKPVKGDYMATIRADFSMTLQPESVILSPSSYTFGSASLRIDGIGAITAPSSKYTHYINLTIPKGVKTIGDNLVLNSPKIPSWISEYNDDTGRDIISNIDKTTGIKNIIQGVADAYEKDKVLTNLKFTVKRR